MFNSAKIAGIMDYAFDESIECKFINLLEKLKNYLNKASIFSNPSFSLDEVIPIPDLHGDFVHMIIALFQHGLLDENLDLKPDFIYVLLGDIYDRGSQSDVIDNWINKQVYKSIRIYRLIGNHEMAFLLRTEEGYPSSFPAQDAVKDINRNFSVTKSLLKNLANKNIHFSLLNEINHTSNIYVHSFLIEDDFTRVKLSLDSSYTDLIENLNNITFELSKQAYDVFLDGEKHGKINWKRISEIFFESPIFRLAEKNNNISVSPLTRRTGVPILKTYPIEIDSILIKNAYQIVGHTPVFLFNTQGNQIVRKPLTIKQESNSTVQFTDVGIGYSFDEDSLDRPTVMFGV